MSDLSILCVTRGERHALPFVRSMYKLSTLLDAELVLALDSDRPHDLFEGWAFQAHVRSAGYIESVLDEVLTFCTRKYVLRLDDDERCSRGMFDWLLRRQYEASEHWKFPRANLWGDDWHYLVTSELWPDHQTRLSLRHLAGGRYSVHAGSPHGGGTEAPYAIEHHKFLVRTLKERRAIMARYDVIEPGAGSRFRAFSAPEDFYTAEELTGAVRPWSDR